MYWRDYNEMSFVCIEERTMKWVLCVLTRGQWNLSKMEGVRDIDKWVGHRR